MDHRSSIGPSIPRSIDGSDPRRVLDPPNPGQTPPAQHHRAAIRHHLDRLDP